MKILLVHNFYQKWGGEDTVFDQERQLLARAGHEVVAYQRSNREIEEYSSIRQLALVHKIIWAEDAREELARLLLQEKPSLVHVHNTFMMVSPAIYSACRDAKIPVVQTLGNYRLLCPATTLFRDGRVCEECVEHSLWRGVKYGCYRSSRGATASVALMLAAHRALGTWQQKVDCYIVPSEFARRRFVAAGLPAEKLAVKPHFVYPDPGEREGNGEYALFVGKLSADKGPKTLLAAWERLRINIPLVIVGDGPLRADLEAEVAQRVLSRVCFRGRLSREQTIAAMKLARFLIAPSESYETFPIILAEAFACGVPVIASRLGAMQEIVEHEGTGLHFVPTDVQDLARKIEWAWSHPERAVEMGKTARREFEAKYTAEKNYVQLIETYHRVLANGASLPKC